jgi:uncharacterized protein YbaR (Trm112 family)
MPTRRVEAPTTNGASARGGLSRHARGQFCSKHPKLMHGKMALESCDPRWYFVLDDIPAWLAQEVRAAWSQHDAAPDLPLADDCPCEACVKAREEARRG